MWGTDLYPTKKSLKMPIFFFGDYQYSMILLKNLEILSPKDENTSSEMKVPGKWG